MTLRTRPILLSALLASPLLLAFDQRGDALSFHPKDGSSVDKELGITASMYIDDLLLNVDGEEMPSEMLGEVLDMALEIEMTEEVTDQYVKSSGGRSLVLLRTFNDISTTFAAFGESQDAEEMDIVDSTVKFTWNEEEEEYDITFEDGGGDDEDIATLDVDMDFTFLLPEDEVKEGATWEVSGMNAARLFLPGGAGGNAGEIPDEALELVEMFNDLVVNQMEDALEEFVVECTYKGEDEDGNGAIAFEFESELNLDLSEIMMSAMEIALEQQDIGVEFDAEVTLTLDVEMEGAGTLTWDSEAGHARAFAMASDLVFTIDGAMDVEAAGESHTAEATIELSGEMEYEMSVD